MTRVTRALRTHLSSVKEALAAASDALRAAGVETPRLDAELLLAEATGWERARLATEPEADVPAAAARRFGEMVRRRLRREPVAYVLGRRGFRSIELRVDRRVLIPRPETELLVELALRLRPRRVLDVGTGSGAVALAIATELPECEVTATDTSPAALEVARGNAERLGLAGRVRLVEGMLPGSPSEFDLLVANLPYVAEPEWPTLEPEVQQWEPREALLAGPDGLDAIRALLRRCGRTSSRIAGGSATATGPDAGVPATEVDAGPIALEVGEGQAAAVADLMREAGYDAVETLSDLAGIPRVVWGRR
jgi:release factor glutamine methyltransferase